MSHPRCARRNPVTRLSAARFHPAATVHAEKIFLVFQGILRTRYLYILRTSYVLSTPGPIGTVEMGTFRLLALSIPTLSYPHLVTLREDFVFVPFVAKKSGPAISRGVVASAGPAGFGHYVAGSVGEPVAVFSC